MARSVLYIRTVMKVWARLLGVLALLLPLPAGAQPVKGTYIYSLATFTGILRDDFSRVALDQERNELYVLYQNVIRVFNDAGMEVYQFGDDLDLGHVVDVAVDERGDILLLANRLSVPLIVRCSYRGQPRSELALVGLPAAFADFQPNRMVYRAGQFTLASTVEMKVATFDREGNFRKGYDLFRLLDLEEKDRGNADLGGFSVDKDGNMLMTVPVLFRAFVLAPDGKLDAFGKPSSAPGGFNIVGGIARDGKGNILVVDRLKGAVLVFDRQFNFLTQFSSRGYKPDELIFPADLAIDGRDRVYVTQMGRRGISVFKLAYGGGTGM